MIDQNQQQAAPGATQPQDDSGTIVCIAPQSDGTFMVYPEGDNPQGTPAADIDAALQAARQMLGGEGTGAPEGQDEAAALIDGFKGARGQLNGG